MRRILLSTLLISYMGVQAQITITDADLTGGNTYNWTANNVYLLDGTVYLEAGATLNIEAGTVIKGKAKNPGEAPSALIISRGATINATGTAQDPIIFTAENDNLTGNLDETNRGLWGGLAILGYGRASKAGADSFQVEGIAGVEPRALMGGYNNADNSGTLRYVSIRYAGFEIGPGDELNGLTLGAVGSGTTLEYIEVFAGSDDGIEFFGGAPNLKYAAVAFCDDDSYDWDLGFRGKGQFWFAINAEDTGNQLFEVDGASPDAAAIWSKPTVFNATLIGSGAANTTNPKAEYLLFRDATGGTLANSIIFDLNGKGLEVEDLGSGIDSYQRMLDDSLVIANSVWFGFKAGNTLDTTGFLLATGGAGTDDDCSDLINHLAGNGNAVTNPGLVSVGRFANQMLDPRPDGTVNEITTGLAAYPNDPFFTQVSYKGAFEPNTADWMRGWTTLDKHGYLANISSIVENANQGFQIAPNPSNHAFTLQLNEVPAQGTTLNLQDINGKVVLSMELTAQQTEVNVANLANGVYFAQIENASGTNTVKVVVTH